MYKNLFCEPNKVNKKLYDIHITFEDERTWDIFKSSSKSFRSIFTKDAIRHLATPKKEGIYKVLLVIDREAIGDIMAVLLQLENDLNKFQKLDLEDKLTVILGMAIGVDLLDDEE